MDKPINIKGKPQGEILAFTTSADEQGPINYELGGSNLVIEIFKAALREDIEPEDIPIFWVVDLESAYNHVTECGSSFLDPLEAVHRSKPDLSTHEAVLSIKNHHLRIHEASKNMLKRLDRRGSLLWAADKFQFGQSQFVSRDAIAEHLEEKIKGYLRIPGSEAKRPMVIVGHAWENDEQYLREIGFDISKLAYKSIVDTQATGYSIVDGNQPALDKMIWASGFRNWHRHNGGNDTMYTAAVLITSVFQTAKMKELLPITDEPLKDGGAAVEFMRNTEWKPTDISLLRLIVCNNCGFAGHNMEDCRKVCFVCHNFGHGRETCPRVEKKVVPDRVFGSKLSTIAADFRKLAVKVETPEFAAVIGDDKHFPTLGRHHSSATTTILTAPLVNDPTSSAGESSGPSTPEKNKLDPFARIPLSQLPSGDIHLPKNNGYIVQPAEDELPSSLRVVQSTDWVNTSVVGAKKITNTNAAFDLPTSPSTARPMKGRGKKTKWAKLDL